MMARNMRDLSSPQPCSVSGSRKTGILNFVDKNRRPFSALGVFIALLFIYTIASPDVFLNPLIYKAVFTALPMSIVLTVPLVFVITSGEIDLSFGSVMGVAGLAFAATIEAGRSPWLALVLALGVGAGVGFLNGVIVTRIGLSSLVSTLGMNFLLRGLINMKTEGFGISVVQLQDTLFYNLFVGHIGILPVQMIWASVFGVVGILVFNYHQFGAHVCCTGDNEMSAREMGINVRAVRTLAFVYVGLAAGIAAVLSVLISNTFWPSTGDGLLLPVLAAVFVGGTPTWGGVGTVLGAIIGAFIVGFIDTGIVAAGLSAYYTRFFYGLIIILSLIGHKFNQPRYRY
jgi:simple sugar transport system permease protein